MDDAELLREFVTRRSEAAFAELVKRHAGAVHAAAMRQLQDRHLAEDVTQAVFIALAQKAHKVKPPVILAGWLHRATRLAALYVRRSEARRRRREVRSVVDPGLSGPGLAGEPREETAWDSAAPLLDDALAALPSLERHAVLLRFAEECTFREIAARLGVSEDAARKRVARSVERLRRYFRRRGLVIGAITLGAAMRARATDPLPEGLVARCISVAIDPAVPASDFVRETAVAIHSGLARPGLITGLATTPLAAAALVILAQSPLGPAMKLIPCALSILAPLLVPGGGASAPFLPDAAFQPTFSRNGHQFRQMAALPDGHLMVSGLFDLLNGVPALGMARLHADGAVDLTFRVSERTADFLAIDPGGRVILRGEKGLTRLNAYGDPDPGFDVGAGFSLENAPFPISPGDLIRGVTCDAQNRLIVSGNFTHVDGKPRYGIVRLNPDGSVDPTFDPGDAFRPDPDAEGTPVPPAVTASAVQPDGRIVVVGSFAKVHDRVAHGITRLMDDGTVDPSFSAGGGAQASDGSPGSIAFIRVVREDELTVSGAFTRFDGIPRNGLARLHPDGSLDPGYEPVFTPQTHLFLEAAPDGSVYTTAIAGGALRRLRPDGSIDNGFSPQLPPKAAVLSVVPMNDGSLRVAESTAEIAGSSATLWRLRDDGSAEPGFRVSAASFGRVMTIAPEPDGKVIAGGEFSMVNGNLHPGIARLLPDGSVDTSFNPDLQGGRSIEGSLVNPTVWRALRQTDGRTIISGFFESVGGVPRNYLARLNPDGTVDPDWHPAIVTPDYTATYALQPDDRLLVAGRFLKQVNGVPRTGIARLHVDGSLDESFDPGDGIVFAAPDPYSQQVISDIAIQTDGRILVAGAFSSVNGVPRTNLFRLEPSGGVDTSFNPGPGILGKIFVVVPQQDGRILLGGNFTRVAGLGRVALARLNPDGSLDAGFDPVLGRTPAGYPVNVRNITRLPDDRLLVTGAFSSVHGAPRDGIALLQPDGSLDTSWDLSHALEYGVGIHVPDVTDTRTVSAAGFQGVVYLGGAFIAGKAVALMRLSPGSRLALARPSSSGGPLTLSITGEPGGTYRIERSIDLSSWSVWTNFVLPTPAAGTAIPIDPAGHTFFRVSRVP